MSLFYFHRTSFQYYHIKCKEKQYKYFHIGLVEVQIKTLTKGLNTSILAVLSDARFTNFSDSLLSMVESKLCSEPILFYCYLNFAVSLNDKNISKELILQIKTHNYKIIEGSIPLALIYKVCYKARIFAFTLKHMLQSKRGEKLLLQTNISKANM